jgi:2,5-dihydroxypyridine 5,6-dioxygenase
MIKIEMIKGAKKILDEILRVQKGENVLIIADSEMPMSIAEILAVGCRERGAEPVITITGLAPSEGTWPPPPVQEAMQKAQVIILGSMGVFHTPSRVKATSAGARCFIMVGWSEEDMFRGSIEWSFLEDRKFVEEVANAMATAKFARITTMAGTDLSIDLRDRLEKIVKFDGVYHKPGDAGTVDLEVAVSPKIGSSQGIIVCDGSITQLFTPGLVMEPVRATVQNGVIVTIDGGAEAKKTVDMLASMGDPLVYNVVEFAIGLNPKASVSRGSPRDKGAYGTCHIGAGSNITWGGKIKAAIHWDMIMNAPRIELDGKVILENYCFNL